MNLYFPSPSESLEPTSQTGNWLLEAGRAITVSSHGGAQLRIARGQVWATLGTSGNGRAKPWKAKPLQPCAMLDDYFLSAGDILNVPAGASVVMESIQKTRSAPVTFEWLPVPQPARTARSSRAEVTQASGELGYALGKVVRAFRRLVGAVLASNKPQQRFETCP